MRVAFHAEHVILPSRRDGAQVHWRDPSLRRVDERVLTDAGQDWSGRIADVFASYDRKPADHCRGPKLRRPRTGDATGASLLTSWIIAPV